MPPSAGVRCATTFANSASTATAPIAGYGRGDGHREGVILCGPSLPSTLGDSSRPIAGSVVRRAVHDRFEARRSVRQPPLRAEGTDRRLWARVTLARGRRRLSFGASDRQDESAHRQRRRTPARGAASGPLRPSHGVVRCPSVSPRLRAIGATPNAGLERDRHRVAVADRCRSGAAIMGNAVGPRRLVPSTKDVSTRTARYRRVAGAGAHSDRPQLGAGRWAAHRRHRVVRLDGSCACARIRNWGKTRNGYALRKPWNPRLGRVRGGKRYRCRYSGASTAGALARGSKALDGQQLVRCTPGRWIAILGRARTLTALRFRSAPIRARVRAQARVRPGYVGQR
jgi:hypothetical protein